MEQESTRSVGPRGYYVRAALLVMLGLVIGLGLSAGLDVPLMSQAQRGSLGAVTNPDAVPESPFVGVVEKSLPAVVFIDVRKKSSRTGSEDRMDDWFHRFFDEAPRRPQRVPSSGSGFIVDKGGHILTNNHVVRDADDITVTLNDKRTFKAKVVGSDPETDVAVIKIDARDLPALPLGDSDKIRVGDWAIAIGNPLGQLRGSVTVGVISARGRSDLNIFGSRDLSYQDFIQTDASINFGNSGGPLCNIRGEAIGINTAINPSGQGIGFAIPINLARHVAEQLVANGEVRRAMLGVQLAELTPELAEGFGISADRGVLIADVLKDQPAEKAGLRRNDVIVEFDGQPVTDWQKFRLRVADTPVGKRVAIVVLRDGKRQTFHVTLTSRDTNVLASTGPQRQEPREESLAGLRVRDLTPEEKRAAEIQSGVVVTEVERGTAAEDAGLVANDVIEEVGGKPVADAAAFARLLGEAKKRGKSTVLFVNRGGGRQFVPLRLSD